MKLQDILQLCFLNLKRRKGRTILTILGVTIGTCSIVIMMSFGFGISEQQEKMMGEMGNLRYISVYSNGSEISETDITGFQQIPGVDCVSPKYQFSNEESRLFAGNNDRYATWYSNIVGVDFEALKQLGLNLIEGDYPTNPDGQHPSVILGENVAYSFYDTMRPEGSNTISPYGDGTDGMMWMESTDDQGESLEKNDPFFDPMNTDLTLSLNLYSDSGQSEPMRVKLLPAGIVEADSNTMYETREGIFMDSEQMKTLRRTLYRENGLPSPPNTCYEAFVIAQDAASVEEIEKQINALGFSAYSQQSMRKAMEESMHQAQLMLGGLGAVSFFVAAIGIANTMIMAVSERTKEIGIMKSIGCHLKDIRFLFLAEAGLIGLFGGILGILVSELISMAINVLFCAAPVDSLSAFLTAITSYGTRISVIPLSMIAIGVLFSFGVGILSGYYPARKATKIPALEAIRSN